MPKKYIMILLVLLFFAQEIHSQESTLLKGKVIGTELSVNYSNGSSSRTINSKRDAFDGNLDTYFASYDRSGTWAGLDLGEPHIITKVGWSPRNDGYGPRRVVLAIFEGANQADFSDAIPLYIVKEEGIIGTITYADINNTRGYRYVRYVGPNDARCNIAEIEFYGYKGIGDDTRLTQLTNLPVVSIHTEGNVEPYDKEHEIDAYISIVCDNGEKLLSDTAKIRLRGNASIDFPKKPYRIKWDEKHKVAHSPAKAKKWTLINNYGDKSLMRNILAFEVSRQMDMEYTPFCQPVDVVVNGEYRGCYQLCDQIEVRKNRIDIEEMDSTCISGSELSGGYLIEVDGYAYDEPIYFTSNHNTLISYKYPDPDEILNIQRNYINGRFNLYETALYSSTFTNPSIGFRRRLDLDSFLKYLLVGEFCGNPDTFWSTYMYKRRDDEHLYTGPVWDFDLAFNNDRRFYPVNSFNNFLYKFASDAGDMAKKTDRILSDLNALIRLKELWMDGYIRGFNEDSFCEYIDSIAEELEQSQQLNFKRWPILNSYIHQNPKVPATYQEEIDDIKQYVRERFEWMNKKLNFDPASIEQITGLSVHKANDPYTYDIAGRKLADKPKKGVYIKNGKKFIK